MKTRLLLCLLALAACAPDMDEPTLVHDLRVLGISTDAPELLLPACDTSPQVLAALDTPVHYRALIVDPQGEERALDYRLWACADAEDLTCAEANGRVLLAEGSTSAGELSVDVRPGTAFLPDGTALLERVRAKDDYAGLGGVRLPLVLELSAGEERIHAQKLLVYSCPLVEGMRANQNPEPPGLLLQGQPWPQSQSAEQAVALPELVGPGPFAVQAEDFRAQEEAYVVPSLTLQPVSLTESWTLAWHASLGEFNLQQTGGTDFGGQESRNLVKWKPFEDGGSAEAQVVTFWVVVRDGRGGLSWTSRQALWRP
ncbi:hypothetical protein FGE12_29545 [Aggregicoccus sp. 17bor-14]|uniref:hypothetical protein n=1 Tax=Myxococcaceae TaxID=31 RepID=UPI00129C849B|nr:MULTISPECIES: hypothetical protein [Myxococcaceae]MBF5046598.1 hypothetical protein [Simulacricoccus sp. 17bor-14]MRI92309.1 hypothetical protein [Aggregicoccus sp. 17bor-14]